MKDRQVFSDLRKFIKKEMYSKRFFHFYVKIICFFSLVGLYYFFNNVVNSSSNFGKSPEMKLLNTENATSQEELVDTPDIFEKKNKLNCTQWIVITTISFPTDEIKYIHDSSFDWCVVVVADKKSPVNWSYKNVAFLSLEVQKQMAQRFKVARLKESLKFQL